MKTVAQVLFFFSGRVAREVEEKKENKLRSWNDDGFNGWRDEYWKITRRAHREAHK